MQSLVARRRRRPPPAAAPRLRRGSAAPCASAARARRVEMATNWRWSSRRSSARSTTRPTRCAGVRRSGDVVQEGQVLCIIEAMKLMNEIESEYDGEIVKAYVENGKPVQFGERLFAIKAT